jgi:hypothetical protein
VKRPRESNFFGLYNATIRLKTGEVKVHKRVFVDNEQHQLGNLRLTDEKDNTVLYVKSDIKSWQFDSKDCYR